jgi:hypothetical protein
VRACPGGGAGGQQAVFGLAWFRDKPDIPRLGSGFSLSQAAACR